MTQSFSEGLADVVACAVVQIHLDRRGVNTKLSAKTDNDLKHQIADLARIVSEDLQPSQSRLHRLPDLAYRACESMLERAETAQTPFGDAFRRYADEALDWEGWVETVVDEFGRCIATLYLDAVYRAALHGELGWEPDSGIGPGEIQRASTAVRLLQRIAIDQRRGRRKDDPDEVRREIQIAVDVVVARGDRVTRARVAAEIPMSESGLYNKLREHRLHITKDGRVEFSVVN